MRIDRLAVRGFKNLSDVTIDFDASRQETVIIGQNGTGKSNVIEAIAIIFRDLDDSRRETDFSYSITYECKKHRVYIDHRYSNPISTTIIVDEVNISNSLFRQRAGEYLPNHVFGYYSGSSYRLQEIFDPPQKRYYDAAIEAGADEKLDPRASELRRLFYVRERYGALALLTYFAFSDEGTTRFLSKNLGIRNFDCALVTLRQTKWGKNKPTGEMLAKSDSRFWYARGIVRKLLDGLWRHSLAPIRHKQFERVDYRGVGAAEEQIHLFIKDVEALQNLALEFGSDQSFFAYLETLDLSDLIRSVRIWVQRDDAGIVIPFYEISDGEKQLLSVLGMMRFAAHDDSLFLLDEPDTHLNPAWKWSYLSFIEEVAGRNQNCHVIMTSHDPLTIAGLDASQVQVLHRTEDGALRASQPSVDPRGLGVAGVLRQIFGMATTLDRETQLVVDERNTLLSTEVRTDKQEARLGELNRQLDVLGLSFQSADPDYDDYLRAVHRLQQRREQPSDPAEIEAQNQLMQEIVEGLR